MVKKKNVMSMNDENMAFFRQAYQNDPKARADIQEEMRSRGMTDEEIEKRYGKNHGQVKPTKPAAKKKK